MVLKFLATSFPIAAPVVVIYDRPQSVGDRQISIPVEVDVCDSLWGRSAASASGLIVVWPEEATILAKLERCIAHAGRSINGVQLVSWMASHAVFVHLASAKA